MTGDKQLNGWDCYFTQRLDSDIQALPYPLTSGKNQYNVLRMKPIGLTPKFPFRLVKWLKYICVSAVWNDSHRRGPNIIVFHEFFPHTSRTGQKKGQSTQRALSIGPSFNQSTGLRIQPSSEFPRNRNPAWLWFSPEYFAFSRLNILNRDDIGSHSVRADRVDNIKAAPGDTEFCQGMIGR